MTNIMTSLIQKYQPIVNSNKIRCQDIDYIAIVRLH